MQIGSQYTSFISIEKILENRLKGPTLGGHKS
jgi:hypothetical protein